MLDIFPKKLEKRTAGDEVLKNENRRNFLSFAIKELDAFPLLFPGLWRIETSFVVDSTVR